MMPENSNPIKEMSWGGVKIDIDNLSSDVDFEVPEVNQRKFTQCGMTESLNKKIEHSFSIKLSNSQYWKFRKMFKKPKLPRKLKKKIYGTRSRRRKKLAYIFRFNRKMIDKINKSSLVSGEDFKVFSHETQKWETVNPEKISTEEKINDARKQQSN